VLLAGLLLSCGTPADDSPAATAPPAPATTPLAAGATSGAVATQEPELLPLTEPGPYYVGKLMLDFEDTSRHDRPVGIRVWYPALLPEGSTGPKLLAGEKRDPDRSGAPYPLILSSAKVGAILAPYVVTHGFVWAGVTRIDTYDVWNPQLIDQPLDILFALDQVASNPPKELEGMIDAEHAGATGYSFDGTNALVLGGTRIDPEFYLAQCSTADATAEAILSTFPSRYQCPAGGEWLESAAQAHEAITDSEDGLWQPITDARIRAVMPLAGEGWLLFGDRGLAAVNRPTLILVATQDELYAEIALIYELLGTPDKALISFVGPGHMMIYDPEMVARMAHFAVAFFGYHLQGHEDLAWYFSEDFVAQHDDLAWGVYEGE
jgi:predicted dienelactone hydrolase